MDAEARDVAEYAEGSESVTSEYDNPADAYNPAFISVKTNDLSRADFLFSFSYLLSISIRKYLADPLRQDSFLSKDCKTLDFTNGRRIIRIVITQRR